MKSRIRKIEVRFIAENQAGVDWCFSFSFYSLPPQPQGGHSLPPPLSLEPPLLSFGFLLSGIGVLVAVAVAVAVGVKVGVVVKVGVGVRVRVAVGVRVFVAVGVWVRVGVAVRNTPPRLRAFAKVYPKASRSMKRRIRKIEVRFIVEPERRMYVFIVYAFWVDIFSKR
jgi:hypothetical protein